MRALLNREHNFIWLPGALIFLLFSLHLCWKQVMFSGFVDGNKVIGAICIYTLIGMRLAHYSDKLSQGNNGSGEG